MITQKIHTIEGSIVDAQIPVIVSASRSTDIPAFYSEWFLNRLKAGYSAWINPFNGVKSYVCYDNVRLIVFWSKDPGHLMDENGMLDYLESKKINCYVQYTLNDYVADGLEPGVPSVEKRIETFKRLVDRLGYGRVIWRFDPLLMTDTIGIDDLLGKISRIGDALRGYTEKLVFSFADISTYKMVKANLEKSRIQYREFFESDMNSIAEGICRLNMNWGYCLATCAEKIDFQTFGIAHNKCIDDDLMVKYFSDDDILMEHIGVKIEDSLFGDGKAVIRKKIGKDKGQRLFCGCIQSKDIGEYNTCAHMCEYCYANLSKGAALNNYRRSRANMDCETITGR